mmetsp:Transcript_41795/g.75238  ORF Transcript_41795/g.75238 Transcript_41795/m.75238 type:complete len:208 (+) Transcript_41795:807-1430(+)
MHPKTKQQRRLLPLGNAPRPLQTLRHIDQLRLVPNALLPRRLSVSHVRRALRRREINLIRTRGNASIEVEQNLGLRPFFVIIAGVIERHGHGTRGHVLDGHARLGLGTHFAVCSLNGDYDADAAVDARSQYREAEGDAFLFGGDEGNVVIPSVPIVVSLAIFAVLCQDGLEFGGELDLRLDGSVGDEGSGFLALGHDDANLFSQFVQ